MSEHTPGPWVAHLEKHGLFISAGSFCIAKAGDGNPPCQVENARLIAAAPDLLAALELFRKAGIGNSTDFEIQAKAFEAMSAALLKAKGE